MEIFMWWLDLKTDAKSWLRENLRAGTLPPDVAQAIIEAGGPQSDDPSKVLSEEDWNFIETQSEFVD